MSRLLYFPTIAVPQNSWLRQSLLYWDGISSMVPEDFWHRPEDHCPGMLEMVREGIVKQEPIYQHTQRLPSFERNFITFLKSNPRRCGCSTAEWVSVHVEKTGYGPLAEFLKEEGLAENQHSMWMRMEPQTADDFMAYLASCVANSDSNRNRLFAATDNQRSLLRMTSQESDKIRFNQHAVNSILPSPSAEVDLRDIVEFRTKNKGALDDFRREVQRRIDRNILTTPDRAEQLFDLELQDLKHEARRIGARMQKRNWGQISFGSLTGLGSTILAAEPLLDETLTTVDGAVTLGLISAVATTISGFQSNHQNGIMTYAVLAERAFG